MNLTSNEVFYIIVWGMILSVLAGIVAACVWENNRANLLMAQQKLADTEMKRQVGLALKDKIEIRLSTEDLKGLFK